MNFIWVLFGRCKSITELFSTKIVIKRFLLEASKFEWTLDDIRIEKIISVPILTKNTLSQAAILCYIKES